ncbi:unnamed protein product, partial [Rotaria magnacalcarata]
HQRLCLLNGLSNAIRYKSQSSVEISSN